MLFPMARNLITQKQIRAGIWAGTVASRRDAAFAKAKIAVRSPRYRLLLLDALQWLETGDWARGSRRYGHQAIERSAADILAKRRKMIIKKAKRLRKLDA